MIKQLDRVGGFLSRKLFGEPEGTDSLSKEELSKPGEIFSWQSISKMLPFSAYDPQTQVFFSSDSLGFLIESIPLVGCNEKTEKDLESLFTEILEEGDAMQFLLFADHRVENFLSSWVNAKTTSQEIYKWLSENRKQYFLNAETTTTRNFRLLISFSRKVSNPFSKEEVVSVKKKMDGIVNILNQITPCKFCDAQEFLNVSGTILDLKQDKTNTDRIYNPYQLLSEQVTDGGLLRVDKDKISYDRPEPRNTVFRSYRVGGFPNFWSLSGMQALIGDPFRDSYRINTPFVIQYGIYMPKQSKEQGSFNTRSQLVENQGKSGTLLRMIPELEDELKECDFIRRELKQGARFVWTQLSVGLWADEEKLESHEQSLKSIFKTNEFRLIENHYTHLPSLISFMPLTWSEFGPKLKAMGLTKTTISTECVNLVPMQGEWLGTSTPGMLLVGRRGQLLNWNPFDNKTGNYNTIVVGRSGSGKSVFMQDLIFSGLSTGSKVFVIDVGRSFEKMCESFSGQQIEFSRDSHVCLNPFTNIPKDDEYGRETAFSFLKSVIGTMAAPKEGTTDFEDAIIEKAILEAWEKKGNDASISDVAHALLSRDDNKSQKIGTMLHPFTSEGNYSKYFEGRNNVNFLSPFVLIELEELKEKKDLQSVILQLYIMQIGNQVFMGDRKTPTYIVIDEAWDLLKAKQTGPFIETLARRLRKYNGALVVGTQNLEEFFSTEGARAAYENSDWQCLLSQKASSVNRFIQKQGENIDAGQKRAIESLMTKHGQYSEIMIADANGNYSICRLRLDPFSEMLYTTQPDEFTEIKNLQAQGFSIVEAVSALAEKKGENNACKV